MGLHGGIKRPSVSFCSASAKNFHFGASQKMTGIKVYSLGINTYSSEYKYSSDQNESILTLVLLTTIRLKRMRHEIIHSGDSNILCVFMKWDPDSIEFILFKWIYIFKRLKQWTYSEPLVNYVILFGFLIFFFQNLDLQFIYIVIRDERVQHYLYLYLYLLTIWIICICICTRTGRGLTRKWAGFNLEVGRVVLKWVGL